MKNNLLSKLLLLLFFCTGISLSQGQTSVQITSAGDTTWMGGYCGTPVPINFYLDGNCTGYNPWTDSMDIHIDFGDGLDTTFKAAIYAASTINPPPFIDHFGAYVQHTYQTSGTYSTRFIATGPDGNADTLININELYIGDSCGNISGKIYGDMNGNCQYDPGTDSIIPYYLVKLMQGSNLIYQQWTDINGDYFFIAPTGNYSVEIGSQYGFSPLCPTSGSVAVSTSGNPVNNLGVTCTAAFDLSANVWGTRFRPGFSGWVYPNFRNYSCQPVSGILTLTLDPLTSYVSSVLPPSSVNGNVITWNFTNIANAYNWYQSTLSSVTVNTSLSAQIGDTVCFTISVTPTTGDYNPANNTFTFCSPVSNSWDPNEKHVAPLGIGNNGMVNPGTRMTYTIHFQNNGTDTAFNVSIVDTIDSDFNIQSIDIIGSSHAMSPNYQGNNIVKFNFNNIMLPDSTTNPIGSQGWVSYSIAPKTGLSLGTQVKNTAYIFFDFNYAIITNTTVNTYDVISTGMNEINQVSFRLYPNPARSEFYIENVGQEMIQKVELMDISGRVVKSWNPLNTSAYTVDGISDGSYMIRIETAKESKVIPMLIRR